MNAPKMSGTGAIRQRRSLLGGPICALLIATVGLSPRPAPAQGESVRITRADEDCFVRIPYPLVDALIRPEEEVQIAKVYFRAAQGLYFYAIDMELAPEGYEAVLPVPGPQTTQVVFYVEAITPSFDASRTEEYTTDVVVEGECDERIFAGDDPGIVIYATEEGASALPEGFLALGVVAGAVTGGVIIVEEVISPPPPPPPPPVEPPASPTGGN